MQVVRGYSLATIAVGVLMAFCVTAFVATDSAKPVTATVGNIEFRGEGKFSPTALPKKKAAPVSLLITGGVKTKDGSHPPALREVIVETDKNGTVEVKGYPTCKSGQLQSTTTAAAKKACKPAIIGEGTTDVSINFPDQAPVPVNSELVMFNGGVKGGVTTLYIHAYITLPVPAAIVTTVKIKKIKKGRYGLLSTASIPVIASGSGSVTDFKLKIDKKYSYKGRKLSVLNLKCTDGKVMARAEGVFADKTRAKVEFVKPCTPKG